MKEETPSDEKNTVDFLGNTMPSFNCMGCAIVSGKLQIPGGIIYEGKNAIIAADPKVPIPGFFIINAKNHVKSFSELSSDARHEIIDIVAVTEKALRELDITKEVTIVQEERSQHLHVWVCPHYDWMDERFGKGVQHLRDIFDYVCDKSDQITTKKTLKTIDRVKNYILLHFKK